MAERERDGRFDVAQPPWQGGGAAQSDKNADVIQAVYRSVYNDESNES